MLVHSGWPVRRALVFNFLSGISFLIGGLLAYFVSTTLDTDYLLPFAAGNFLYMGATDLVPEINKRGDLKANLRHLAMFVAGLALMYLATLAE